MGKEIEKPPTKKEQAIQDVLEEVAKWDAPPPGVQAFLKRFEEVKAGPKLSEKITASLSPKQVLDKLGFRKIIKNSRC